MVPASHKTKDFIKVPGAALGTHAALYKKDATVCTYCHAGSPGDLPNSAFCKNCHKVDMPHPAGFGMKDPQAPPSKENAGSHAAAITSGQVNRPTCLRLPRACLLQRLPPHGLGPDPDVDALPPVVVKKSGADSVLRMSQRDVLLQLPREPGEAGPAQVATASQRSDWKGPGRRGRAPSSSGRASGESWRAACENGTSLR